MKQKRIKVTATNIADGIREAADACPIAQALRSRKNVLDVAVESTQAEVYEHLKRGAVIRTYRLPSRAKDFIAKFDAGRPVKPFSFKLGALIDECEA